MRACGVLTKFTHSCQRARAVTRLMASSFLTRVLRGCAAAYTAVRIHAQHAICSHSCTHDIRLSLVNTLSQGQATTTRTALCWQGQRELLPHLHHGLLKCKRPEQSVAQIAGGEPSHEVLTEPPDHGARVPATHVSAPPCSLLLSPLPTSPHARIRTHGVQRASPIPVLPQAHRPLNPSLEPYRHRLFSRALPPKRIPHPGGEVSLVPSATSDYLRFCLHPPSTPHRYSLRSVETERRAPHRASTRVLLPR